MNALNAQALEKVGGNLPSSAIKSVSLCHYRYSHSHRLQVRVISLMWTGLKYYIYCYLDSFAKLLYECMSLCWKQIFPLSDLLSLNTCLTCLEISEKIKCWELWQQCQKNELLKKLEKLHAVAVLDHTFLPLYVKIRHLGSFLLFPVTRNTLAVLWASKQCSQKKKKNQ